jgi:hypothetical protein
MAIPNKSDDASKPKTPGTIQIITPDAILKLLSTAPRFS